MIPVISRLKENIRIRNSWVHFPLLVGFGVALLAQSVSSGFPPPIFSVGFVNQINNVSGVNFDNEVKYLETTEFCKVLKSDLKHDGLVMSFDLRIPRDQNDYQLFASSNDSKANFIMVNEQRQIVWYPGEASGGYELTDLGPRFYNDILLHQKDNEGKPIIDLLKLTIYLVRVETDGVSEIVVYGLSEEPAKSTVVKKIDGKVFGQTSCKRLSEVGLDVMGASGSLKIGVFRNSQLTDVLQKVGLWRASPGLTAIAWAVVYRIFRGKKLTRRTE